ncbi:hypothetical protein OHC33_007352 [Knufia fluminis]|uniref:Uncharacterized protein n=1 Tax=Knufia fluminis TaxID=191047 RepID=A0AAN8ET58_9EURO|nr:hypothetical protein OHC33_007352 [Knufia fluminis]
MALGNLANAIKYNMAKPTLHYPLPPALWQEGLFPDWTNDPQNIENSMWFNANDNRNLASDTGIKGLGPVLRHLEDDQQTYLLKDANNNYCIFNPDDSYLYAYKEGPRLSDVIDDVLEGIDRDKLVHYTTFLK